MKFKKGIWTAAILLAGIFLETGTVFAEAGVKNLEGNQMPTGDLAEYTPREILLNVVSNSIKYTPEFPRAPHDR